MSVKCSHHRCSVGWVLPLGTPCHVTTHSKAQNIFHALWSYLCGETYLVTVTSQQKYTYCLAADGVRCLRGLLNCMLTRDYSNTRCNLKQHLAIFHLKQRKLHSISVAELLSFISPGFVDLLEVFYLFSYIPDPPLILFIEVPVFHTTPCKSFHSIAQQSCILGIWWESSKLRR